MRIGNLQPGTYSPQQLTRKVEPSIAGQTHGDLGQQVKNAIDDVNNLQHSANGLVEQVVAGKSEDTHKAMIAMEHASIAFDFTLQIRNKVLDAYQEIMKTQT